MVQESRQRAEDYAERVRTGRAADWKMTSAELLQHVADCNPGRVEAGDGIKVGFPIGKWMEMEDL